MVHTTKSNLSTGFLSLRRFKLKGYLRRPMSNFKGKVVWITGGNSGIGEAVARNLAAKGARLILSARREDALRQVADRLPPESRPMILALDVTDELKVKEATDRVMETYGKVDLLFNAAGISQRSSVVETDLEVHRKIMEVNYFATVSITKSVLPHMLKAGRGHVAVITSLTGKFGFPMRSAYAASKHALHGFFESLHLEYKHRGIDVTVIAPGPVNTPISFSALGPDGKPTGKMDEMQAKAMSPEVCARHIVDALEARKQEVVIGTAKEKFGAKLNAWWPSLFFNMLSKQHRAELKKSDETV